MIYRRICWRSVPVASGKSRGTVRNLHPTTGVRDAHAVFVPDSIEKAMELVNTHRGRNYLWNLNNYNEEPDSHGKYPPSTVTLDASTAGNVTRYMNDCVDRSKINVEALREYYGVILVMAV